MENIDQSKDTSTSANNLEEIQKQISTLQAQIAGMTKTSTPNREEGYINYNLGATPINEKENLLAGANIGENIKSMYSSLEEYKDYFPTSVKENIEESIKTLQAITKGEGEEGEKKPDLKVIQNDLSLLMCKVFFDYEGVDIPEHLIKKVEKVKNAKKYSPAIKEEVKDLLPHVPYVIKALQGNIDRKKNAGLNFNGFSDSKRDVEYYMKAYSQGVGTITELKEYLDSNPQEKQKYHQLIDNTVNEFCKKRGYKRPTGLMRGLGNYTIQ